MAKKYTSAEIEIKGKDTTAKSMKSAQQRVGGLTKLVKSYFAEMAAGYLIVRKIVNVTQDLVNAYNKQLTSEAKLIATLKSTGRWTQSLQEDMFAFAKEMQSTTGIADELVIAAESIMATFTKINTDTFPEAIELAADMSTLFGQDLQQSVIQLGTALNDPIVGVGRLKRIGISFSEDQKKSIELFMAQNDIMSAQRVILDELQVELGGVAKALGETTAGQMKILSAAFGDLKEQMGETITDAIAPMLPLAISMVIKLGEWVEAKNDLRDAYALIKKPMEITNLNMDLELQLAKQLTLANDIQALSLRKLSIDNREYGRGIESTTGALGEEIAAMQQELAAVNTAIPLIKQAITAKENQKVVIDETIERIEEEIEVVIEATDKWTRWANSLDGYNQAFEITDEIMVRNIDTTFQAFHAAQIYHAELKSMTETILELNDAAEEQALKILPLWEQSWQTMGDSTMTLAERIKEVFKNLFASLLEMIGKELLIRAMKALIPLAGLFNPAGAALAFVGSAAAFTAAGYVKSLREGGNFITSGPEIIMVGDNPGGRERVQVTPMGSPNIGGSGMFHVTVNIGSRTFYDDITEASANGEIVINASNVR